MAGVTGPFHRQHRLLRSREYRNVLQCGRRTAVRAFVVFVLPPDPDAGPERPSRLGITVSRKVGNAVVRNRVKRRVREWFRRKRESLPAGADLVVIGRRGAGDLSSDEIASCLDDALCGSGALAS